MSTRKAKPVSKTKADKNGAGAPKNVAPPDSGPVDAEAGEQESTVFMHFTYDGQSAWHINTNLRGDQWKWELLKMAGEIKKTL